MTPHKWKMLLGLAAFVDLLQILLDLLAVGIAVNRAIDIGVAFLLPLYLQINGVSMASPKRFLSIIASFTFEMIPVVDSFPLWTLDVYFLMKTSQIMEKAPPIVKRVAPLVEKGIRRPSRDTI